MGAPSTHLWASNLEAQLRRGMLQCTQSNNGPALMQFAVGSSQAAQERCAAVECDGARDRH